eukprot:CAMPEP_0115890004 /NCGR_PEP_ID=MMETSP0287-20121206/33124_1 /TAXON_ID=412157 /ORGANISM="Chrysochromulina rotalis, Strain UIO044" /LENGTH=365 /DNA_ID=CAMNT_0003346755 /DNA_START=8 /DNA_END=1107 /DNA_ORIENTATION=-
MVQQPREHGRHEDVELLFQHHPQAGIRFLRPLLVVGSVTSVIFSLMDAYLLHTSGCSTSGCSGLSGIWVGVQMTLQLLQLPVRMILLVKLNQASAADSNDAAADQLVALNRSMGWRVNKQLGGLNLAWFVVGIIAAWRASAQGKDDEYQLRSLVLAHLLLFVFRCASTVAWFVNSFGGVEMNGPEGADGAEPRARGGLLAIRASSGVGTLEQSSAGCQDGRTEVLSMARVSSSPAAWCAWMTSRRGSSSRNSHVVTASMQHASSSGSAIVASAPSVSTLRVVLMTPRQQQPGVRIQGMQQTSFRRMPVRSVACSWRGKTSSPCEGATIMLWAIEASHLMDQDEASHLMDQGRGVSSDGSGMRRLI